MLECSEYRLPIVMSPVEERVGVGGVGKLAGVLVAHPAARKSIKPVVVARGMARGNFGCIHGVSTSGAQWSWSCTILWLDFGNTKLGVYCITHSSAQLPLRDA